MASHDTENNENMLQRAVTMFERRRYFQDLRRRIHQILLARTNNVLRGVASEANVVEVVGDMIQTCDSEERVTRSNFAPEISMGVPVDPEMASLVDRTAFYAAKHGRPFESRFRQDSHQTLPLGLAFLLESSPLHPYYEERVLFQLNNKKDRDNNSSDEGLLGKVVTLPESIRIDVASLNKSAESGNAFLEEPSIPAKTPRQPEGSKREQVHDTIDQEATNIASHIAKGKERTADSDDQPEKRALPSDTERGLVVSNEDRKPILTIEIQIERNDVLLKNIHGDFIPCAGSSNLEGIVQQENKLYQASTYKEKAAMIPEIVARLKRQEPPAR